MPVPPPELTILVSVFHEARDGFAKVTCHRSDDGRWAGVLVAQNGVRGDLDTDDAECLTRLACGALNPQR